MTKAGRISIFQQAFLWHTIGGRVKSAKNKEGFIMIGILCVIVFPFVVLGYLLKMNK